MPKVCSAAEEDSWASGLRKQRAAGHVLINLTFAFHKVKGERMKCSPKWLSYFPGSFLSDRATEKKSEEPFSSSHPPLQPLTSFSFKGQIRILYPTASGYSNQTNQDMLTPIDFLPNLAESHASRISGFQHFWGFMIQTRELKSATHNHKNKCNSHE